MNCSETQNLLSAFYDGELSSDRHAIVAEHLSQCESCAESLAGFQQLSAAFSRSATPPVPLSVWDGVVRGLDRQDDGEIPFKSDESLGSGESKTVKLATTGQSGHLHGRGWSRATYQRLAIAASILLVLGLSVWISRHESISEADHEHSQEFVATMDHYLRVLPNNPDKAEQFLLDKYNGQVVAPDEAVSLVGYRPAVADGLPAGYSLASTSVLKMPCCTCVKAVCKRQDGSTLVLFEHDDQKVEWFGDRASSMAICGDKECCLVDLDSSIAATWREGSRSVTAVGLRDHEEVAALVQWFEQT
jgi:hypothetical protein